MTTLLLLELFTGFMAAGLALWFVVLNRPSPNARQARSSEGSRADAPPFNPAIRRALAGYVLRDGLAVNIGLLVLRLAIGVLMIHHGQEKLADPQQFANTYVASLHLPFPLFFAYAAGFSELIGSWLLILGILTPLGALAITGTMTVAAYQHILTAGLNIYVLELVALYLGGSLALLLIGPGRYSFDGGIVADLISESSDQQEDRSNANPAASRLVPIVAEAPGSRG
ncbi:DoxX family protein [Synechococcus sp. Tobar12-5m-g]|uniref:DoxX family protein n=1 Tax=unclassified Synechococcus TaxID=2626047 RepID=UPI0020CE8EE0|nr:MULTISPECIES: DoxX family protein [unclassified Synechococcus]MCP9771559.1 DoxX family protein [Synechococcus sp. Tobar12-5m-g]MCP9872499.1 DoxX family protein [Synechococcus sp. Cruz CV-v-12]